MVVLIIISIVIFIIVTAATMMMMMVMVLINFFGHDAHHPRGDREAVRSWDHDGHVNDDSIFNISQQIAISWN